MRTWLIAHSLDNLHFVSCFHAHCLCKALKIVQLHGQESLVISSLVFQGPGVVATRPNQLANKHGHRFSSVPSGTETSEGLLHEKCELESTIRNAHMKKQKACQWQATFRRIKSFPSDHHRRLGSITITSLNLLGGSVPSGGSFGFMNEFC